MQSQAEWIPPTPVIPVQWLQGPYKKPTFEEPTSTFIVGNPNTGKTNQGLAVCTNYLAKGHKVIHAFGVGAGAEELVWFKGPWKDRTVMITGDNVDVETKFAKVAISDFTLDTLKDYDVAVTTRGLFGWNAFGEVEHYHALAKIFSLCRDRRGYKGPGPLHDKIIVLMVAEAWEVVYSQIRAGVSKDEQDAWQAIRKLDKQKYHTGIAPILDSQRYQEVQTAVRQQMNYNIIKGFGGQPIPDEFDFLFKPHLFLRTPWKLRNMPPDEFIMVTSWNGVATGLVDKVPWNSYKGEDLLDDLKIVVKDKEKEAPPEQPRKPEVKRPEHPFRKTELHNKVVDMHNQGLNYLQIERETDKEGKKIGWQVARYHILGLCACNKEGGE